MSPVRASAGPVDGFVPAIDAAARDVAASTPPLASSSLHRVDPIADVAVDAWSVSGGTTLGVRFAGVETKLFQAGLLPYLVYLYFLGKDEARTPPASNFGARFLLLFVFATIPAGITAKTKYGDILANVDLLHGSSESLLTVSNFLFAFGFAAALADATATNGGGSVMRGDGDGANDEERDARMSAPAALFTFLAAAGSGCAALAFAGQSAGLAVRFTRTVERAVGTHVGRARVFRDGVVRGDAFSVGIRGCERERRLEKFEFRDGSVSSLWVRGVYFPFVLQRTGDQRAGAAAGVVDAHR